MFVWSSISYIPFGTLSLCEKRNGTKIFSLRLKIKCRRFSKPSVIYDIAYHNTLVQKSIPSKTARNCVGFIVKVMDILRGVYIFKNQTSCPLSLEKRQHLKFLSIAIKFLSTVTFFTERKRLRGSLFDSRKNYKSSQIISEPLFSPYP